MPIDSVVLTDTTAAGCRRGVPTTCAVLSVITLYPLLAPSHVGCRAGILKVGLKSLVEDLRLATLSRPALHQAQLDIHHLRPALRRCVL